MSATQVTDSHVDVLIIGAGPAGLMSAAWMAHCGIKTRIIDRRNTKIIAGQADGLQCRSLEIFDSLGFADRVLKECNRMLEICMWNPGPDGVIHRSDRIPDTIVGLCRFQQVILRQGRIERFFLDNIKKYSDDAIKVDRCMLPESISIDEATVDDADAYPVTVTLRKLSDEEATPEQQVSASKVPDGLYRSNLMGSDDLDDVLKKVQERGGETEVVHAKYVVGCDGARSWTRHQLGLDLEGDATDFIWGVMDIIPITDFPDIRMRCAIHSAENGSLMVIPREDKMVRLYIQLKEVTPDASGRADKSKITPEVIFGAAQKIMSPYKIDYEYCDWWTAYQIGQRVCNKFDVHERVFLAGDAVHTHSPKAGQGMNISMQDAYNLGWKIALAVKGIVPRSVLKTYESERRPVAQELIEFDRQFSRLFSGRPAKDVMDEEGIDMEEFKRVFVKGNLFASGLSINYGRSNIVAKPVDPLLQGEGIKVVSPPGMEVSNDSFAKSQALATGLPVGKLFHSYQVINQSCARPWYFQQRLKADGRFRVVLFAGNILDPAQKERVDAWAEKLDAPGSFLRRATPEGAKIDSVIEVLTIHSSKRVDTELLRDFPDILHPFDPAIGWDYDKIYVDDESHHEGFGDAYKNYGVDPQRGVVVAVRPDQVVGWVGELEDFDDLQKYFEACLVLRTGATLPIRVNGST